MPPKKSNVWKHFKQISPGTVKCLICSKTFKSNQNTSNMRQHIRLKHRSYEESEENQECDDPLPFPSIPSSSSCTSSREDGTEPDGSNSKHSDILSEAVVKKKMCMNQETSQPSIIKMLTDITSNKVGGTKYNKTTQAIVEMIIMDHLPFRFVEGKGFQNLMKQISPLYTLPCRNTIRNHVDKLFETEINKFRSFIQDVPYLTLTTDIWTDTQMVSMLGLTVHGLVNDEMFSGTIGVVQLNEAHTSRYLADVLQHTINENNIKLEQIVACVTDNGANIVKAVCDLLGKEKHIPCFAHLLNLVCENSLNITGVKDIVTKCRDIICWLKRRVNASDELRKIQLEAGVPEGKILKPILDVKTRWNSTFYMLERFTKILTYINQILLNYLDAPPMITSTEKEDVYEIISLLRPLEAMTVKISAETHATMSQIIPLVRCGHEQLLKINPKFNSAKLLKEKILSEFDSRFGQIEKCHLMADSTLLDPRFKNLHFNDAVALSSAIKRLRLEISNEFDLSSVQSSSSSSSEEEFDIWKHHKNLVHKKKKMKVVSGLASKTKAPDDEMVFFLNSPVTSLEESPITTWNEMKAVYPKLYSLSRKYCHLIGTSVPSERLFSEAGSVANEKK